MKNYPPRKNLVKDWNNYKETFKSLLVSESNTTRRIEAMNEQDLALLRECLYGLRFAGLTVKALAMKIGVTSQSIYNYRYGARPTTAIYEDIIRLLGEEHLDVIRIALYLSKVDIEKTMLFKKIYKKMRLGERE